MTIVNTIDITKEKPRYNKNGKSIIFSKKELKPSNTQSIVTAITLQRQNPRNSIPKNSRNKTNRPNRFLCFSFFICSPLQSYKMQSAWHAERHIWKRVFCICNAMAVAIDCMFEGFGSFWGRILDLPFLLYLCFSFVISIVLTIVMQNKTR